jgi:hypothetical protein
MVQEVKVPLSYSTADCEMEMTISLVNTRHEVLSMIISLRVILLIVSISSALSAETAYAQWSTDPTNNLIVDYGLNPELCTDGMGGCYVTYEQGLTYPRQLSLARLTAYGYKAWVNSKKISGIFPDQRSAKILESGQDGVLISYVDGSQSGSFSVKSANHAFNGQSMTYRVRVQKVDSSGNFLWGSNGVRVSLSEVNQGDQAMVSDGHSGCFVAWYDSANNLWLQRVNQLGQLQFGDSGIIVDASNSAEVLLISDGEGGCILNVQDANGARLHRLDSTGSKLWGSGGVRADTSAGSSMISDGHGGLISAGVRFLSYNNGDPYYTAYAQRIDSSGRIMWGSLGLTIDDSIQNTVTNPPLISLILLSDESCVFEWYKRMGSDSLNTFTQRVRQDGLAAFPSGGIKVSVIPASYKVGGQWLMKSLSSNTIHIWSDNRIAAPGIYAQITDSTGQRLWNEKDIGVVLQSIGGLRTTTDGAGGFILVGYRESDFTIRAQQVSVLGNLGEVISDIHESFSRSRPTGFILYQNYPNPFNPTTTISYTLPTTTFVDLMIFDINGRQVKQLTKGLQSPGTHRAIWDGTNDQGKNVSSGVYFSRLKTEGKALTRKIVLAR